MREDFSRDSTPTALACFAKDKSTTAEKIVSIKEEESTASRRSVPKRKAFTNACGVIQGAMTDEEDDYIALGFRGGVYSYTDWNNNMANENRTSGGLPDYFGMSTSSGWESIYGPQPLNGRIALG